MTIIQTPVAETGSIGATTGDNTGGACNTYGVCLEVAIAGAAIAGRAIAGTDQAFIPLTESGTIEATT